MDCFSDGGIRWRFAGPRTRDGLADGGRAGSCCGFFPQTPEQQDDARYQTDDTGRHENFRGEDVMRELNEIRMRKCLFGHKEQNRSGKKFHGDVRVEVMRVGKGRSGDLIQSGGLTQGGRLLLRHMNTVVTGPGVRSIPDEKTGPACLFSHSVRIIRLVDLLLCHIPI